MSHREGGVHLQGSVSLPFLEGHAACCLLSDQSRRELWHYPTMDRLLKLGRPELFRLRTMTLWTVACLQCGRKNKTKQKARGKLKLISGINVWVLLQKQLPFQAKRRAGAVEVRRHLQEASLKTAWDERTFRKRPAPPKNHFLEASVLSVY